MFRNFRVDLVNNTNKLATNRSIRQSRGAASATDLLNTSPPIKNIPQTSKQQGEIEYLYDQKRNSYLNQNDESDLDYFMEEKPQQPCQYLPYNQKNRHNECILEKRRLYQQTDFQISLNCLGQRRKQIDQPHNCKEYQRIERKTFNSKKCKEEDNLNFHFESIKFFFNNPNGINLSIVKTKVIERLLKYQPRKEQLKRDSNLQVQFFGQKVTASHISRAMLRNIHLLATHLTMQDHFKINLNEEDFKKVLQKQPSLLRQSISQKDLTRTEKLFQDNDLLLTRKQYLIESAFSDKKLNYKDREVMFKVIIYHLEQALRSQERLDRIGVGLGGLKILKQNPRIDQLNKILSYINKNYQKLVKRKEI